MIAKQVKNFILSNKVPAGIAQVHVDLQDNLVIWYKNDKQLKLPCTDLEEKWENDICSLFSKSLKKKVL